MLDTILSMNIGGNFGKISVTSTKYWRYMVWRQKIERGVIHEVVEKNRAWSDTRSSGGVYQNIEDISVEACQNIGNISPMTYR